MQIIKVALKKVFNHFCFAITERVTLGGMSKRNDKWNRDNSSGMWKVFGNGIFLVQTSIGHFTIYWRNRWYQMVDVALSSFGMDCRIFYYHARCQVCWKGISVIMTNINYGQLSSTNQLNPKIRCCFRLRPCTSQHSSHIVCWPFSSFGE